MQKFSYLKSSNADYIDELFARYAKDPDSVDSSWRYFFEGLELASEPTPTDETESALSTVTTMALDLGTESKVADLIQAYRDVGKLIANVNPLSAPPQSHPLLELTHFQLTGADLDRTFHAGKLIGMGPAKLSEIIARLREIYCGTIGAEIGHVLEPTERVWLQKRIEGSRGKIEPETQKMILRRLTESETLERFLHTRYVAQKRFSVEGGEGVIPTLDCFVEVGAELGAEQFVLGMAHRGRLNVLINLFGKKPEHILTEFEGAYKADTSLGEGDVKYHMGYSADVTTRKGKQVHLSLGYNPSHLEFINPVVEGMTRAKQNDLGDTERARVVPILIHGDAAFAGQGVCYETLNFELLPGYSTGGTLHVVINNQVGFTTNPKDSRSTTYCTDVAKMLDAPIFHVNGDDPEALWFVAKLCIEYRQQFKKDAFIDIICYRKHGHNEGDEPSFTQPLLYKTIKAHASPREIYARKLIGAAVVSETDAQKWVDDVTTKLTECQTRTKAEAPKPVISAFEAKWKNLRRPSEEDLFKPATTTVSEISLKEIAEKLNHVPAGFHVHPKLNRFLEGRLKAVQDGKGIDWGNGEALAFASLVFEGHPVRLSGQDAERGTFTHRHSVLSDFETGETYTPLNHLKTGQAPYHVHNSHLSETAVLGFEYGYSLADPETLVIWEAQFGDFANGAQVIIDQFLASSESKWQRMSGLTLLLPHGFEGQGPEHSSARLERFLQLCGRSNLQVCNLTTPAQLFHALRRQITRNFRKPLVIMSPKSLLRHPMAISKLDDFTKTGFQEVLLDPTTENSNTESKTNASIKKVLLCSGKVYYELLAERETQKRSDVAIVRVEQLYPFPAAALSSILAQYPKAEISWVQEEPRNMGAWSFIFGMWCGGFDEFQKKVGDRPIRYVGRTVGAAPAVGSHKIHEVEQKTLVAQAFQN